MKRRKHKIIAALIFGLFFCVAFQNNSLRTEAKVRVVKKDVTPREPLSRS